MKISQWLQGGPFLKLVFLELKENNKKTIHEINEKHKKSSSNISRFEEV